MSWKFVLLGPLIIFQIGCILAIHSNRRDDIREITSHSNRRDDIREITSGRAIEILNEIKQKAQINEIIHLYSYRFRSSDVGITYPLRGDGILKDDQNRINIYLRYKIFINFSYDALRGIIAHEVGHFVAGHVGEGISWDDRSKEDQDERQRAADDFAIDIYGEEAVNKFKDEYKELY